MQKCLKLHFDTNDNFYPLHTFFKLVHRKLLCWCTDANLWILLPLIAVLKSDFRNHAVCSRLNLLKCLFFVCDSDLIKGETQKGQSVSWLQIG